MSQFKNKNHGWSSFFDLFPVCNDLFVSSTLNLLLKMVVALITLDNKYLRLTSTLILFDH